MFRPASCNDTGKPWWKAYQWAAKREWSLGAELARRVAAFLQPRSRDLEAGEIVDDLLDAAGRQGDQRTEEICRREFSRMQDYREGRARTVPAGGEQLSFEFVA